MPSLHEGHIVITTSGRIPGVEDVGLLVCIDCLVILERLPLCGAMTKKGHPCRWVIRSDDGDLAVHPHAPQRPTKRPAKPVTKRAKKETLGVSQVEAQWLAKLVAQHGQIDGNSVVLTGIKRGQAVLLIDRYGGRGQGDQHADWQWRCEGQQAERIITAIRTDGRGE